MRLARAAQLVETGRWFDQTIARSNAPFGEILHWTRPLDALLIAGAAPLAPLIGWRDALFAWGLAVSPVLHAASLLLLLWAARPLLDGRGTLALAALFALQLFLAQQFSLGRPDHHALLLTLFIWQGGLCLRGRASAALPAALALWVSVEALPAALLPIAWAGALWLARGEGAGFAARYAGLLAAGLAVALAVERGPGALAPAYDSLSVVHLTLAALLALAALAATLLAPSPALPREGGGGRRALAAATLAAGVAGVMAMLWPRFFAGPLTEVEPRVVEAWFASVAEVEPLRDPALVVAHLGLAALALAATPWRERRWAALGATLAVYVALALWQQRWASYAQILAVIPAAALLARALPRAPAPLLPAAGVVPALAPLFLAAALQAGGARREASADCPLTAAAKWLAEAEPAPQRIMSFIFYGPELLWRSGHEVVATPYHRNGAGIGAALDVLGATDEAAARRLAAGRGIDLVLVCPAEPEAGKYRSAGSLLARLEQDAGPAWLAPVALPERLAPFRLYRVAPSR